MKNFICWFVGCSNTTYQVIAKNRKEAISNFANMQGVKASSYIQCRKVKKDGEYCLLESGAYGILHP